MKRSHHPLNPYRESFARRCDLRSRIEYLLNFRGSIEEDLAAGGYTLFDSLDPSKSPQSPCLRLLLAADLWIYRYRVQMQGGSPEHQSAALREIRLSWLSKKAQLVAKELELISQLSFYRAVVFEEAGGVIQ